jgi:uncharacterized protein (TIGR00730 family)
MSRLAIFCGSSRGHNPNYSTTSEQLAELMVQQHIGMVYGGGSVGLMGVLADKMMAMGGEVIGVIPKKLYEMEVGHGDITQLHVVDTMHERKAMMMDLANAFVALPGGIGTLEEIMEVMTWAQIGYHHKPCAFLNVNGFYDHLTGFFDHMVEEGFLKHDVLQTVIVESEPEMLLKRIFG